MGPSTVLITGATDGLGRWLAVRLATAGIGVVLHGRNAARLDETVADIRAAGGTEPAGVVRADLADLAQVDRLADEVSTEHDTLDVLVNNAAVGFGARGAGRELSADGIELRFAVNYLAGFHLTRRLLPTLLRSGTRAGRGSSGKTPGTRAGRGSFSESPAPARVVNVVSIGQVPIDFADPMLDSGYDGFRAYRQSKLAQIMFTIDLAEEVRGTGLTVNSLHPASLMKTTMVREADLTPLSTLDDGGEATLRLIVDPDLADVTGAYFDQTMEATPNPQAADASARRQLRELSDRLVRRALGA